MWKFCALIVFCLFQNPNHLPNHGFGYCPQFKKRSDVILLPNNVLKEIIFEVINLPSPSSVHTGFQCIIVIEGATMLVPARVDGKNIVCDKTTVSNQNIILGIYRFIDSKRNKSHFLYAIIQVSTGNVFNSRYIFQRH